MARTTPRLPPAVIEVIAKLGRDLKAARRRQFRSTTELAMGAQISRATLAKVERGDPAVSLGIYAAVLDSLSLLDGLSAVADGSRDKMGRRFIDARLPQRIHSHRRRRKHAALADDHGPP